MIVCQNQKEKNNHMCTKTDSMFLEGQKDGLDFHSIIMRQVTIPRKQSSIFLAVEEHMVI